MKLYFMKSCYRVALLGLLVGWINFTAHAWQLQSAPVTTDWTQLVDTNNPLPEYPRPQMVRTNWLNLNGLWQFQAGAINDPVPTNQTLATQILVPFPMESALSGVAEYHARSWYRRMFTVPAGWSGQNILLHLDAVDWESEVFINGHSMGIHKGGYDEATYNVTPYLVGSGAQELIVRVYDPTDNAGEPRGKQTLTPGGIMYTSCSGIWQPVWLEPVPATSIANLKLIPDIDAARLNVTVNLSGPTNGVTVNAIARSGTNFIGSVSGAPGAVLALPVTNPNLWSPTNPFLYDLEVTVSNGPTKLDAVTSYFGMRKISLGTNGGFVKMLLNNQFVFQFGPLDQGFWPDGIYTAPTDDALKSDIESEKTLGFNMVRKHIKVERARWYYWADKLGIMVWQDMPSINSYTGNPQTIDTNQFAAELTTLVQTHWNHPAIIMWVPFNEAQGQHNTVSLVAMLQLLDPSRLVNQASGNDHFGVGDLLDDHSYPPPSCPTSATQAVACGEFGGVGLGITNHTWAPGWGYVAATNGDDLTSRFEDFCGQLNGFVQNRGLSAAVYTETTDVETELNGFSTYDRKVCKPDVRRMQAAIASVNQVSNYTVVLATSQASGQTWRYTNSTPPTNWFAVSYNDATWSNGLAGFGAGNPPNTTGILRTPWSTADIWLRRTFNPGSLTASQISNLVFSVYHDEDVEIYLNGVLAGSATGYNTDYGIITMNAAGKVALLTNANNVLAVHCHQTGGGQYIDVGLGLHTNLVLALPSPPAVPTGVIVASGSLGVSLGWNTAANATSYKIKRSAVSGGPYTNVVVTPPLNAGTDLTASNSTVYYYVVSAVNAAGESANSVEVSVTTVPPATTLPAILTAWFKADGLTGLTNGAAVATWPDASGNGFDATQITSSKMPKLIAGAINGRPVVRFNSTNLTYLAFARPVKNDFTIVCVFRSTQGVGTGTQFYQGAGLVNGEMAGTTTDFGISLNANGKILAGTGQPDVTAVSSNSIYTNGLPHVLVFTRTRSTGELKLFVDGSLQGTNIGGTQSLTAPAQLVLGAQQTLINYLNGDLAEVKIYDAALSDPNRVAEENSLACKYGLGAGAAPPIPAGLTLAAGNRQVLLNWFPSIGATSYTLRRSTNNGSSFVVLAIGLTTNSFVDVTAASGKNNLYTVSAASDCGPSAYASVVSVFVSLPTLAASFGVNALTLSWPSWANDWLLYSATNLTPPVAWSPITNAVFSTNGNFMVTLPPGKNAEFFHLQSP